MSQRHPLDPRQDLDPANNLRWSDLRPGDLIVEIPHSSEEGILRDMCDMDLVVARRSVTGLHGEKLVHLTFLIVRDSYTGGLVGSLDEFEVPRRTQIHGEIYRVFRQGQEVPGCGESSGRIL